MPCFAASDLGLHCLPMSQKWDARACIWVKSKWIGVWVPFYQWLFIRFMALNPQYCSCFSVNIFIYLWSTLHIYSMILNHFCKLQIPLNMTKPLNQQGCMFFSEYNLFWSWMPSFDQLVTFEAHHEKTCSCHMRTTKAQISLCIRAVWSVPLLFAAWIV